VRLGIEQSSSVSQAWTLVGMHENSIAWVSMFRCSDCGHFALLLALMSMISGHLDGVEGITKPEDYHFLTILAIR